MRRILAFVLCFTWSFLIYGQVRHEVFMAHAGHWVEVEDFSFVYGSDVKLEWPNVDHYSSKLGLPTDQFRFRFSLGYRRRLDKWMVEVLYLYKKQKAYNSPSSDMRRLEVNMARLLTPNNSRWEGYVGAGGTYHMHAIRRGGAHVFRGYSINLNGVITCQVTPSIIATASIGISQLTTRPYRTIRHMVGVGYRW